MSNRRFRAVMAALTVTMAVSLASIGIGAQFDGPVFKAVACPDVKNYLAFHRCALEKMQTFEPPRTSDGKPDLRGQWGPTGVAFDIEEFTPTTYGPAGAPANVAGGKSHVVDPPSGKVPWQPWAAEIRKNAPDVYVSPTSACFQPGPQRFFLLRPVMVLQQPNYIVFVTERYHGHRVVPLDGRTPLGPTFALWLGESRGRWEGNTLVVETTRLNGLTWFDQFGNFLSAEAHLVERFTYVDPNTLHYQQTITDPKVFTRPWTIATALQRSAAKGRDAEIWYEDVTENCHLGLDNQLNQGRTWWPGLAVIAPWMSSGPATSERPGQ